MDDKELDEHEALLQFLYLAPVGLVSTDLDGTVNMINPLAAQLLLPVAPNGELDNVFTALEGVAPELRSLASAFTADSGPVCENYRAQLTAGVRGKSDPHYLGITLMKLDATRLMAVLSDLTQTVKQERLLRQSEAWFNAILTGVTDYALTTVDNEGRVEAWNESVGRLTGHEAGSVVGQPFSIFYPEGGITPEHLADRLHEADADGWSLDDGWRVRADGSRFWGSVMVTPLEPPVDERTPRSYALILRDVTEKRDAIDAARLSSTVDHLTGLANRRAFFEAAEVEIQRCKRYPRPLSLVMFDCDHFKAINDRYGHPGGDEVLRHFAGQLRAVCREVDLVARIGGEEFIALLPSTDVAGALAFAERVRQGASELPVVFDGRAIPYSTSAGVASWTEDTAGLDALIKRADRALYAAKSGGRNRVEMA
nr:diguanylate cyclase [uncultured Roseateles sp.]